MQKTEYLNQLKSYLAPLSVQERRDIIDEIDERFRVAREQGETVDQVVAKIGTAEFLAQSYLKNDDEEANVPQKWTMKNTIKLLMALAINGLFVVWVWGTILSMVVTGIFVSLSGGLVGLVVMVAPLLKEILGEAISIIPLPTILYLSSGLTILLMSLLGALILAALLIWLIKMLIKYIKFNVRIVRKN